MYETLYRLFINGKLTELGIINAVTKGWITDEEKEKIINSTK
jgi:hypothetical protein